MTQYLNLRNSKIITDLDFVGPEWFRIIKHSGPIYENEIWAYPFFTSGRVSVWAFTVQRYLSDVVSGVYINPFSARGREELDPRITTNTSNMYCLALASDADNVADRLRKINLDIQDEI